MGRRTKIHTSGLARQQYSFAQQIEVRSAEHLALDQLDSIYIPFHGAGTPVHGEASVYGQPVVAEVAAETAQLRWTRGLHVPDPLFELPGASLTNEDQLNALKDAISTAFLNGKAASQKETKI